MGKLRGLGCVVLVAGIVALILPLFGYVLTIRRYVEIGALEAIIMIIIGGAIMLLAGIRTRPPGDY